MSATVADAIREGQRGIRQLEPEVVRALLGQYDIAWQAVERILYRYEAQIQAAIDAGVDPRPSWLRQQRWYRQVQASIDAEMVRFEADAARTLARGQAQAVGISAESARLFAQAVGVNTGIVARVNAGAFERWVSALRPGSPVRGVLDGYGGRISESLALRMSEGLGLGQGASGILRDVRRDVGPDAVRGRVHSFIRHETQRAYRGSSRDQYAAMPAGVIESYRWVASLSTRTCPICIALHGTTSRRYRMDQHVACRCAQIPVVSAAYAPPRQWGETGAEWFARQDAETQQRIFTTHAHYDLYRTGTPLLAMVGRKQSKTWGPSVRLVPASALRGVA